jgi:NAD(P)-dependent dehydrogenase (short-subunit alcohol dehydrogenase family)
MPELKGKTALVTGSTGGIGEVLRARSRLPDAMSY